MSCIEHVDVLFITSGDPWGISKGGQTTFAKHLLTAFGSKLAVTSNCDDPEISVGKWIRRPYNNQQVWFFNRGSLHHCTDRKPIIPARINSYWNTKKFMSQIYKTSPKNVIIDSPELLFVATSFYWNSICFRFAGVNNPVLNSRYRWSRALGRCFEQYFVKVLNRVKPDAIIAAADHAAIEEFNKRTGNKLDRSRFYQFPTRVDTELFHPMDTVESRKLLAISAQAKVFVMTGRLCWIKGWDLLLEAFAWIKEKYTDALLVFVGDGEDHEALLSKAKVLKVLGNVIITGFVSQSQVVKYINSADVCLVGSHCEGWSLAMCEILACGKAIVSTDVSGAREMVKDGENGYVIRVRDPHLYATAVLKSLNLLRAREVSLKIAESLSVKNLARDLGVLWEPLRIR